MKKRNLFLLFYRKGISDLIIKINSIINSFTCYFNKYLIECILCAKHMDKMMNKKTISLWCRLDTGGDRHKFNNRIFDKYHKRDSHGAGCCIMRLLMVWVVRKDLPGNTK